MFDIFDRTWPRKIGKASILYYVVYIKYLKIKNIRKVT